MKKITILFLLFNCSVFGQIALPGGVSDPSIWYKTDEAFSFQDYTIYKNSIRECQPYDKSLFNFNFSLAGKICLEYRNHLEDLKNQNIFVVSHPRDSEKSYRHFETVFYSPGQLPSSIDWDYLDSLSRNVYALDTKQGYASQTSTAFSHYTTSNLHFYNWSNYDQNKIFKSFGAKGETNFRVGPVSVQELQNSLPFEGQLPEFVVFDRLLNDNERNRVESYLALKYGITLDSGRNYLNAGNKIFWNKKNNKLFANHIFGIGRDDISALHQLQSESFHQQNYLIMGLHSIEETNAKLQEIASLKNNDFLVSGHSKAAGISDRNAQGLRFLNKVWLAQISGKNITTQSIYTKFDIRQDFNAFLDEILHENLFVYMVQDPFVNHTYISEFDNGNIIYTKADNLENAGQQIYAHFSKVFFDQDLNHYDQYTFAVGPEIIIQIRYAQDQCKGECFDMEIVIQGGEPYYEVSVETDTNQSFSAEFDRKEGEKYIYIPEEKMCAHQIYKVRVRDRNGTEVEYFPFEVEERNNTLDLGSDQILSNQQPEVSLDAGAGLDDPDSATYQWTFNGEAISHNERELVANQLGKYCVKIVTGDLSCTLEDCIEIKSGFRAAIRNFVFCDESENYIEIYNEGGVDPISGLIEGINSNNGFSVTFPANTNPSVISQIPEGSYKLTLTDAVGAEFEEYFDILYNATNGGPITIVNNLAPILSESQAQLELDATQVLSPAGNNVLYQWKHNDNPLAADTGVISIDEPGIYKVVVYDENNCPVTAQIEIEYSVKGDLLVEGEACEMKLKGFITYGLSPYCLEIFDSNEQLYFPEDPENPQCYTGDFEFELDFLPTGEYTVTLKDSQETVIAETEISMQNIELNIYEQAMEYVQLCGGFFEEDYCNSIPHFYFSCNEPIEFDASELIDSSQDVSYEWYFGSQLFSQSPVVTLNDEFCSGDGNLDCENGSMPFFMVIVTDNQTGCFVTQSFFSRGLCPDAQTESKQEDHYTTLSTHIYPNPGRQDVTFYYEVYSEEHFSGTVQIYNMTGALIKQQQVSGETHYTLPFNLLAAGTYFIRITTDDGIVKTDRIIIK